MICKYCQKETPAGFRFCANCGKPVEGEETKVIQTFDQNGIHFEEAAAEHTPVSPVQDGTSVPPTAPAPDLSGITFQKVEKPSLFRKKAPKVQTPAGSIPPSAPPMAGNVPPSVPPMAPLSMPEPQSSISPVTVDVSYDPSSGGEPPAALTPEEAEAIRQRYAAAHPETEKKKSLHPYLVVLIMTVVMMAVGALVYTFIPKTYKDEEAVDHKVQEASAGEDYGEDTEEKTAAAVYTGNTRCFVSPETRPVDSYLLGEAETSIEEREIPEESYEVIADENGDVREVVYTFVSHRDPSSYAKDLGYFSLDENGMEGMAVGIDEDGGYSLVRMRFAEEHLDPQDLVILDSGMGIPTGTVKNLLDGTLEEAEGIVSGFRQAAPEEYRSLYEELPLDEHPVMAAAEETEEEEPAEEETPVEEEPVSWGEVGVEGWDSPPPGSWIQVLVDELDLVTQNTLGWDHFICFARKYNYYPVLQHYYDARMGMTWYQLAPNIWTLSPDDWLNIHLE